MSSSENPSEFFTPPPLVVAVAENSVPVLNPPDLIPVFTEFTNAVNAEDLPALTVPSSPQSKLQVSKAISEVVKKPVQSLAAVIKAVADLKKEPTMNFKAAIAETTLSLDAFDTPTKSVYVADMQNARSTGNPDLGTNKFIRRSTWFGNFRSESTRPHEVTNLDPFSAEFESTFQFNGWNKDRSSWRNGLTSSPLNRNLGESIHPMAASMSSSMKRLFIDIQPPIRISYLYANGDFSIGPGTSGIARFLRNNNDSNTNVMREFFATAHIPYPSTTLTNNVPVMTKDEFDKILVDACVSLRREFVTAPFTRKGISKMTTAMRLCNIYEAIPGEIACLTFMYGSTSEGEMNVFYRRDAGALNSYTLSGGLVHVWFHRKTMYQSNSSPMYFNFPSVPYFTNYGVSHLLAKLLLGFHGADITPCGDIRKNVKINGSTFEIQIPDRKLEHMHSGLMELSPLSVFNATHHARIAGYSVDALLTGSNFQHVVTVPIINEARNSLDRLIGLMGFPALSRSSVSEKDFLGLLHALLTATVTTPNINMVKSSMLASSDSSYLRNASDKVGSKPSMKYLMSILKFHPEAPPRLDMPAEEKIVQFSEARLQFLKILDANLTPIFEHCFPAKVEEYGTRQKVLTLSNRVVTTDFTGVNTKTVESEVVENTESPSQ